MKIGILTYHRANNVGAVLQNYALQQILLEKGVDVETINYFCEKIEKENRIYKCNGIKAAIKRGFELYSFILRESKFNHFRNKYLQMSRKYTQKNISGINDKYDKFIVGSDQVWNTKLNDRDLTYVLDCINNDEKKYAYAGSFGFSQFPLEDKKILVDYLRKFSALLVRENEAKELLKSVDINSEVVLDPTLLLAKEKWNLLLENLPVKKSLQPFVFVYLVASTPRLLDEAKEYAKQNHMQVYCMHYNYKKYEGCINLRSVSPDEFLFYIKNAHKVFCSSFHAVCFSIIYEKDFVCALDEMKENNNSRLLTLCQNLGLEKAILRENRVQEELIDYKKVKLKLDSYREKSIESIDKYIL